MTASGDCFLIDYVAYRSYINLFIIVTTHGSAPCYGICVPKEYNNCISINSVIRPIFVLIFLIIKEKGVSCSDDPEFLKELIFADLFFKRETHIGIVYAG